MKFLSLILGYVLMYTSCWIHELAHYLVCTLLIRRADSLWVTLSLNGQTVMYMTKDELTGWRPAVIFLVGPIAGVIWISLLGGYIRSRFIRLVTLCYGLSLHLDQLIPYDNNDGFQILRSIGIRPEIISYVSLIRIVVNFILGSIITYIIMSTQPTI